MYFSKKENVYEWNSLKHPVYKTDSENEQIYMLYAYPKSKKVDPPASGSFEATETTC
jgi:hypothetical protein